jgi:hypothetical protein
VNRSTVGPAPRRYPPHHPMTSQTDQNINGSGKLVKSILSSLFKEGVFGCIRSDVSCVQRTSIVKLACVTQVRNMTLPGTCVGRRKVGKSWSDRGSIPGPRAVLAKSRRSIPLSHGVGSGCRNPSKKTAFQPRRPLQTDEVAQITSFGRRQQTLAFYLWERKL